MSLASKSGTWMLAGCLLSVPLVLAHADQPTAPQQAPAAHRHKSHKKAPLVLPPLPPGPLHQVPLDQIPAAAPKVTYENGLLSIAAQNSTLGEILRDVRKLTGASIELPPNGATERVVTQLGPGAPRDVLAVLLNGTAFNYVMLGTPTDPSAVASVVITPKPTGEVQTAANTQPVQETPEPAKPPLPFRTGYLGPGTPPAAATGQAEADDSSDDSDDESDDSDQAQPAQPGQAIVTPDVNNGQNNQPNAGPRGPLLQTPGGRPWPPQPVNPGMPGNTPPQN